MDGDLRDSIVQAGKALYRTGNTATAREKLLAVAERADGEGEPVLASDLRAAVDQMRTGSGSAARRVIAQVVHLHWPDGPSSPSHP